MRRLLTLCLVAGLGLMACGGDDSSESEEDAPEAPEDTEARDEYVAELADEMENDPEFPLDSTQATCFAEALVDEIGHEALEEAGIDPTDLAEGGEEDATSELIADHRDELTSALVPCNLSEALGPVLEDELGASAESLECVFERIDEEEFAALLVGAALGEEDNESGEAYGEALMSDLDGPCAKRLLLDVLVSQGAIPPDASECVEANLDEAVAQRLLDPEEQEGDPAGLQAELEALLTPCV